MSFSIESVETPDCACLDTLPARIFQEPGIALAASGSLACLRTLHFQAERAGKLPYFFWTAPTARDYSLGRQGKAVLEILKRAAGTCGVRGVIFYASCLEVITMWDFEGELRRINSELRVPVRILYRGPLVKRLAAPGEALQKILEEWRDLPVLTEGLPLRRAEDCTPPPRPDFEGWISRLAREDCDIFLFTPGGCKKCLTFKNSTEMSASLRNSRFDDVFIGRGSMEEVCQQLLCAFPGSRPLYLLSSAVPYATGMDLEKLAEELRHYGKRAVFVPCNGLDPA